MSGFKPRQGLRKLPTFINHFNLKISASQIHLFINFFKEFNHYQ